MSKSSVLTLVFTVLGTVISGTLVFLLGEIAREIWLNTYHDYKKLKGSISYALTLYANLYTNPIPMEQTDSKQSKKYDEVSDHLRSLGCELLSMAETRYHFNPGIPKKEILIIAGHDLIGLSNSLWLPAFSSPLHSDPISEIETNSKRAEEIRELLCLIKDPRH